MIEHDMKFSFPHIYPLWACPAFFHVWRENRPWYTPIFGGDGQRACELRLPPPFKITAVRGSRQTL